MKAVEAYESLAAEEAIKQVQSENQKKQLSRAFEVTGHLFDKAILNRLLDMAVDSPCDFEVEEIQVPPKDELSSRAVLRLYSDNQEDIELTISMMKTFVESSSPIADCALTEIPNGNKPEDVL